jgi:hypothetical protein
VTATGANHYESTQAHREMEPDAPRRRSCGALGALERAGDLWDMALESDEFLEPYNLSPDDKYVVTGIGWGKQCVDCGDVRDYYMVSNEVWRAAGLQPNQCCCCKCLSVRLGRPLKRADLTMCPANTWNRVGEAFLDWAPEEGWRVPRAPRRRRRRNRVSAAVAQPYPQRGADLTDEQIFLELEKLEQTDPEAATKMSIEIVNTFVEAPDSGALNPTPGDDFETRRLKLQAQRVQKLFRPNSA